MPTPVPSGLLVNKNLWPTVGDTLPNWIRFVIDLETGNVLPDLGCQFHGGKSHGINVVAGPNCQILGSGFHQLHGGVDCIIAVNHRQGCVFAEVAVVSLA